MAVSETGRQVRAQAKWVRVSPRKAQVVVKHIRGRTVPEARTVLAFTPRAAAREIEEVLASDVANAEANHGLVGDELVVTAAYVDEGPTIKRSLARARGRVARVKKRTCHVTVRLAPGESDGQTRRPRRAQAEAAETPEATEQKPKRTTRARKAATPKADAAEKPKRTRTPRKKKESEA